MADYEGTITISPAGGGTATAAYERDGDSEWWSDVFTLTATPASGYSFDHWEVKTHSKDYDGNEYDTTFTFSDADETAYDLRYYYIWKKEWGYDNQEVTRTIVSITAYFKSSSQQYFVAVYENPTAGGTVAITSPTPSEYSKTVDAGTSVTCSVKSVSSGYRLLGWKDESGNKIYKKTFDATINSNKTYTAYFAKTTGLILRSNSSNALILRVSGSAGKILRDE